MDRYFYVRTTTTISRDFIVRANNRAEAERVAQDLMNEKAPEIKEGQTVEALRNDKDSNFSTSESSEVCKDSRISLPDFLEPLWLREAKK